VPAPLVGATLPRDVVSTATPDDSLDCAKDGSPSLRKQMQVKILCMARCLLAGSLWAAIAFVSCWQPTSMQRVAARRTSTLKNRIPPADPKKYRSVVDAHDWQNPYVMVQAKGIYARPISAATGAPVMSPADMVTYLEKLPPVAWPYGLVVAVQENGVRAAVDDALIKKNREELVQLLEEAGVRVEFWPSA
jgi:hypothetical protein